MRSPILTMAGLDPATQQARGSAPMTLRADPSQGVADAAPLGGRVKPGHGGGL